MNLVEKVDDFLREKGNLLAMGFMTDVLTKFDIHNDCEQAINSPMEQLFYIEWQFRQFCNPDYKFLYLDPQYQDESTGKYRLDFSVDFIQDAYMDGSGIEWDKIVLANEAPKLGIEIDGHIWHEKTKGQVQYHKERERFLISNEWKLLRFTGSEIYKNPTQCVDEVLIMVDEIKRGYIGKLRKQFKGKNK